MRRFLFILLAFPLLTGFSPVTGPTDLGNEAYGKGRYEDALKHYREAAEANPDSPEAHYNLGNAYYRLGEHDKAAIEFDKAAKLDPKMADAHYNEGDSLYRLQKYDDALKAFGRAKDAYAKPDPDTEYNIELTKKRIERQKQQQKQRQQQNQTGDDKKDNQDQNKGMGSSGGSQQSGNSTNAGQRSVGQPPMSNEELKSLLDRQAKEEKRLRNYFRPGDKPGDGDRESEIEQMLRGMGFGPIERMRRPGEPYVERDW